MTPHLASRQGAVRSRVDLDPTRQRGAALVLTLIVMALLSAVGGALVLGATADALIAEHAGLGSEAFYAAEAALERAFAELREAPDFTAVLTGGTVSRWAVPPGEVLLPGGIAVRPDEVVNLANCHGPNACSDQAMDVISDDRPYGARNPRWRAFSAGPMDLDAPWNGFPVLTVVLVADDPWESDGDPTVDGGTGGATVNPGAGRLLVRAEAFGRLGAHRVIEAVVVRPDLAALARWHVADPAVRGAPPALPALLQVVGWRERR